jgi:predicted RNase H-like nuclease (RuvC/YqgF family)
VAKTDSGSSDESEDFNNSMGDPLETTMSENQVNPESTDEVQVSLSCADCGERKEKIEKLQKTRSKLNRHIAGLKKENENLRKVVYRDLNLPHYSSTARNHKSYLDLQRFFAHP